PVRPVLIPLRDFRRRDPQFPDIMNAAVLSNIVIVLDQPQNLVNIAGVVRAMKNMGLSRLRLVRPAEFDAYRITGIAHRSDDLVEAAEILDDLDDAVADCVFVLGTSARARTAQRNYGHPREWGQRITQEAHQGKVAVVFGREDRGLSNEALDRCDGVVVIPTDPGYSSMNLAQACLLIAYEIFLAAEGTEHPLPRGKRSAGPATRGEIEEMLTALEGGLDRIEFFKARSPESVMRIFRTLLARADLDRHEAGLVKALGFEIGNYLDRNDRRGATETPGS
ncbi:MAG: TrmJ/YjtD family RNA methyltransferase, partial [Gemmatimonadota bacterium]